MNYLEEAYRRFKLPIRVMIDTDYADDSYCILVTYRGKIGVVSAFSVTTRNARDDYLAAVKELSQ